MYNVYEALIVNNWQYKNSDNINGLQTILGLKMFKKQSNNAESQNKNMTWRKILKHCHAFFFYVRRWVAWTQNSRDA